MTQPAETYDSIDAANSNREDLSDMIWDVSPDETPFLSAMKKNKATATTHEFQTDALAAAGANAAIEGDAITGTAVTAPSRLNNYTQTLKKAVIVSGTQEAVNTAGYKSTMAYNTARRMKEIKLDLEWAMLDGGGAAGIGNAKAVGSASVAREMGSIQTYLITNTSTSGTLATGDGSDVMVAGVQRDFTTTLLDGVLSTGYTNGANPTTMYVSPTNKGVVSEFTTGGATRYVTTDDKKLTTTIDVYVGDFHTLKVVPSRQMANELVLCIDHDYVACSTLRPLQTFDLAKTGDNHQKAMVMEATLEVSNEKAHCMVADTNG